MRIGVCLAAFALAGCVSLGAEMDLAAAQRIPTGTPISRVIAKFGPPDGSHFDANGFQFLRWTQTRGSSAHSSRINGVVLRFDTNGRYAGVESYTLERVN